MPYIEVGGHEIAWYIDRGHTLVHSDILGGLPIENDCHLKCSMVLYTAIMLEHSPQGEEADN